MTYATHDSFSPSSRHLRNHFEKVMGDDHNPLRFSWDFWNKPGRYTHLRTPAEKFFTGSSAKHLDKIKSELQSFGEKKLGCRNISPLWLSCYVEGCEQKWHADRPHGPWAFVLSLCPQKFDFLGGETILLKPEILNFWSSPGGTGKPFEDKDVVDRVSPLFNRLTVFDPRIPHGVSPLKGTMSPLEGRLVIHGWFTQPRPYYVGPLPSQHIDQALRDLDETLANGLDDFSSSGTIAFDIQIRPNGRIGTIKMLASSLASAVPGGAYTDHRRLATLLKKHFAQVILPKANRPGTLTLPLSFLGPA